MVATRWPACSSATATCMAVVDFPEPPFSLPRTMTCADTGAPTSACINMDTQPQRGDPFSGLQRSTSRYSIVRGKLIINYIPFAKCAQCVLGQQRHEQKVITIRTASACRAHDAGVEDHAGAMARPRRKACAGSNHG